MHKGAKRKGIKSSIGRLFGKKEKGRLIQLSRDGATGHGFCPLPSERVQVEGPEQEGVLRSSLLPLPPGGQWVEGTARQISAPESSGFP